MPSRSKSQQRLFGMVSACQKTGECASPEIEKIADGISKKDARDFAKTKHKKLPEKVKKKKFKEWLEERKKPGDIISDIARLDQAREDFGSTRACAEE